MFASMDLSNGWMIASRADVIGFTDETVALLQSQRADIDEVNRFRDVMLAAAKALFDTQCGLPC